MGLATPAFQALTLDIDDLTVTVKYSDGTSKAVTDYSTDAARIDMGTPGVKTLKITYQENNAKVEASVQIKVKERQGQQGRKSMKGVRVRLAAASCAYTGKLQKPKVSSVTLGNAKLKAGRDYKVSYKNNRNIGKAAVIVTGIGNYTGKVEKTFSIKAKKGTKFTVGAYKYKIINQSEVAFAGIKSAKTKRVSIPKTAKIGGKKFKVTSIAARALKNKKITSVTVGANVRTIGAEAFYNCKKLGAIKIKSTRLKSVGRNAFKGIKPTAAINVPKKKLRAYRKLLKGKGQGRKVKIRSR